MNIRDIMGVDEISASLTPAGTPGDALWAEAMAELDAQGTSEMRWPKGIFTFADTIIIGRRLSLIGEQTDTSFRFPADKAGIVVTHWQTMIDGMDFYKTTTGTDNTAHGISVRAKCLIRNTSARNFEGNGIDLVASTTGNGANANLWRLDNVTASGNRGHGLYVNGKDANAGSAIQVNATSNGGCGIFEDSLLGNAYYSCHTSGNGWRLGRAAHGGNHYFTGLAIADDATVEPDPSMTTFDDPWYLHQTGEPSATWPAWNAAVPYQYAPNYYSKSSLSWCEWIGCYSEQGGPPNYFPRKHNIIGGDLGGGVLNAIHQTGDKLPRQTLGHAKPGGLGKWGDRHLNDQPTQNGNNSWVCLSNGQWVPEGAVGLVAATPTLLSGLEPE